MDLPALGERKAIARYVGRTLDTLYPKPPIPLDHSSPYTLLAAVMLSAQCTDKKVNEVTPALFGYAGTAEDMAKASVDEVLGIIRPLGLAPTKAKNLVALSQRLCELHEGQVPRDIEALEDLPGVGHKTASVVMSQAFGEPAFPVDTHIHRLAARWYLSSGLNVTRTEVDLKALFARRTWNRRHLQIIYYGREHCPARSHSVDKCQICRWVEARLKG